MHHDKVSLNPYLTFGGNCAEAMNFYKEALEGELETMPFEGSPMEVPEDYKQKIMHSTLRFGYGVLMASDSMPGQNPNFGDNVKLSINAKTEEEGEKYFDNLAAGGNVIMPFEKTFWGAKFGMLVDKFGVFWMVDVELGEQK